jgi:hypothetical protein
MADVVMNHPATSEAIRNSDGLVYHYTREAVCSAILQPTLGADGEVTRYGTLRATSMIYLNDRSEYAYGEEKLRAAFEASTEPTVRAVRSAVLRRLNLALGRQSRRSGTYCLCCSFNGDLLSQWRAYGHDGRGCSIGFVLDSFQVAGMSAYGLSPGGTGYPVVYDVRQQAELALQIVDALGRSVTESTDQIPFDSTNLHDTDMVSMLACALVCTYAPLFKHPAFSEEAEFRNVVYEPTLEDGITPRYIELVPVHRQCAPASEEGGLTSYEVGPARMPVGLIVVGPGADQHRAVRRLRKMLEGRGYDPGIVDRSNIPYLPRAK